MSLDLGFRKIETNGKDGLMQPNFIL